MKKLYREGSFQEKGTLKQIQNIINRTNLPKLVKDNFNAVRDFLNVVIDAHIIAAALEFFGMDHVQQQPTQNCRHDTTAVLHA